MNSSPSSADEHQPATFTETTLVEAMAQHHWLRQRALHLESCCYDPATGQIVDQKQLALYLRYQTTHERGFHKALNDLLKLRAAKRKEQIGFESQQRAERGRASANKSAINGRFFSPKPRSMASSSTI